MKKLRYTYFTIGLAAIAFALLAKHIPGVTISDFVYGFCHGLALACLIAGIVTAAIPLFCRKDGKDKKTEEETPSPSDSDTPAR